VALGQPAPSGVGRIGDAALEFSRQLTLREPLPLLDPASPAWNASPDALRSLLSQMRVRQNADRARINDLPAPNLRGDGIDLSFVAARLRQDTVAQLDRRDRMLNVVDQMLTGQAAGDCAAMETGEASLNQLRAEAFRSSPFMREQAIQSFFHEFADAPGPPIPVAVDPGPTAAVDAIAAALAKSLRCPLVATNTTFDVTATTSTDGTISTSITSISDQGLRARLQERLASAHVVPRYVLTRSSVIGQPLRFHWRQQHFALDEK
jgi:hypothetical protein